jgi:hypothetical protein
MSSASLSVEQRDRFVEVLKKLPTERVSLAAKLDRNGNWLHG